MFVTFYSFKGGVGRSMALANVAEVLADLGYNVIVCDWDLEAPGLERYFADSTEHAERLAARAGLMDLLLEHKENLRTSSDETESAPTEAMSDATHTRVGEVWLRRPLSL